MASVYLHIPFCEKKCLYCDFYSIENISPMEDFLRAVHHEIDVYAEYGQKEIVETVFFGGGTPSLLTPQQLEQILAHLHRAFRIADGAEITVETNPGTVTREKLADYRSLGVNRLSIGVQSFDNDELRFLSRIHTAAQAVQCVEAARAAEFENVSLDLMYALPCQTLEAWERTLRKAIEFEPNHISAYSLIVEDGTPLARMVQARLISPTPPEEEAEMYELTMALLEDAGYEHYEVSNYARPGFRSRHNANYWHHANYLGFGPSAHSFWKDNGSARRWVNIANISQYCTTLARGNAPVMTTEILSHHDLLTERIFLGLRSDGLDMAKLESSFSEHPICRLHAFIADLVSDGYVAYRDGFLRLTRRGYVLCDEIAARMLAV